MTPTKVWLRRFLLTSLISFLLIGVMVGVSSAENTEFASYKFAIAGHEYGSHHDQNPGLYPKFSEVFRSKDSDYQFILFAGD